MTSATPMRVLIADDEPLARQRIEDLLAAERDVRIVGTVDSGTAAVDAIRALAPDLVFLDVQMPGKTGIEVVREIGVDAMPATIFVTAYDTFAIQAFEMAAVDYLVKPFDDDRFAQTIERARRMLELRQMGALREQLLAVLGGAHQPAAPAAPATPGSSAYLERIAVEMRGKVRIVPVGDVDYIVASGPYAELHVGDRLHLIRESMQTLEERLDPSKFMRVHRSIIVRLDLVDTLRKGGGGDYEVQLKTGARLRVSRSRREELERRLGVMPKVRSA
jgi:two-component system LytT family response regulator